jgi:hypothetical protein
MSGRLVRGALGGVGRDFSTCGGAHSGRRADLHRTGVGQRPQYGKLDPGTSGYNVALNRATMAVRLAVPPVGFGEL